MAALGLRVTTFLVLGELRHLHRLPNDETVDRLDAWLAWASRSKLRPFVKLARTIRQYKHGVLAAIELASANPKRQLGMVGLSGLTLTAGDCWHGDDWARRDVQQPHHHTAQEQSRNRPVPASAHDDQICSLLPSDVRDLMRGLGTDVLNDREARSETILRELLDSLLELRLHSAFVGIHGKPSLGRVVLDDVDNDKRSRVVKRERFGDFERLVGLL
jgi:Transposase